MNVWQDRKSACFKALRTDPSGLVWSDQWTEIVDSGIRRAYRAVIEGRSSVPPLSVVATGGYGRRELSPKSDVDLIFVSLQEPDSISEFIRVLHRAVIERLMGDLELNVDYAIRMPSDIPGLDPESRTALMDARLVAGSQQPLDQAMELLWSTLPVGEFLLDKIKEREAAQQKLHATPWVTEPELKEGAGGLRSFHAASWIRMALGHRPLAPNDAYDYVLKARNLLHLERATHFDLLSHQVQPQVSTILGTQPREFMSELLSNMAELFNIYESSLASIRDSRFELTHRVQVARSEVRFSQSASASDAAAGVYLAAQLGLDVCAEDWRFEGTVDGGRVLRALAGGSKVVRQLDASGVLGALLPELEACRAYLPHDASHRYTVHEHSLQAIEKLEDLPRTSAFWTARYHSLSDLGELVLALLLHDVGKRCEDRPHADAGAEIAEEVCRRWGLTESKTETVAWLVREHLALAHIARVRDPHHPATIKELVKLVGDRERLHLLALLTVSDIQAVQPGLLTPSQDLTLQILVEQAEFALGARESAPRHSRRASTTISDLAVNREDVARFVAELPVTYLMATRPEDHPVHMQLVSIAQGGEPAIQIKPQRELGVTTITLAHLDEPGLLERMLGLIYKHGIDLVSLSASTTQSNPPTALDVFTVSHHKGPVPETLAGALAQDIREHLADESWILAALQKAGKAVQMRKIYVRLVVHPGDPAVIEARGDGQGLAFRLARAVSAQGWNIVSARVGHWAGKSTASFTITGQDGSSLDPSSIESSLLAGMLD